jgi:Leucine-rich repeat (LRR) protein
MDSNCIEKLCKEIDACDCLKELLLHSNGIVTFLVSLQALSSLRLLALSNNRFHTFPSALECLVDIKELW